MLPAFVTFVHIVCWPSEQPFAVTIPLMINGPKVAPKTTASYEHEVCKLIEPPGKVQFESDPYFCVPGEAKITVAPF